MMTAIASQITNLTIVYSSVRSGEDQRKHQSSVWLAFVRGIHRRPVNSPHKRASNAKNVSIWWRNHERDSVIWKRFQHYWPFWGIPITGNVKRNVVVFFVVLLKKLLNKQASWFEKSWCLSSYSGLITTSSHRCENTRKISISHCQQHSIYIHTYIYAIYVFMCVLSPTDELVLHHYIISINFVLGNLFINIRMNYCLSVQDNWIQSKVITAMGVFVGNLWPW